MRFGRDVEALLRKLLLGYNKYFHNDVLNSDGRRLFMEILRMLLYEHPEYRRLVYRVRRRLDLDSVLRVAELVLGREEAMELLEIGVYGVEEYST